MANRSIPMQLMKPKQPIRRLKPEVFSSRPSGQICQIITNILGELEKKLESSQMAEVNSRFKKMQEMLQQYEADRPSTTNESLLTTIQQVSNILEPKHIQLKNKLQIIQKKIEELSHARPMIDLTNIINEFNLVMHIRIVGSRLEDKLEQERQSSCCFLFESKHSLALKMQLIELNKHYEQITATTNTKAKLQSVLVVLKFKEALTAKALAKELANLPPHELAKENDGVDRAMHMATQVMGDLVDINNASAECDHYRLDYKVMIACLLFYVTLKKLYKDLSKVSGDLNSENAKFLDSKREEMQIIVETIRQYGQSVGSMLDKFYCETSVRTTFLHVVSTYYDLLTPQDRATLQKKSINELDDLLMKKLFIDYSAHTKQFSFKN